MCMRITTLPIMIQITNILESFLSVIVETSMVTHCVKLLCHPEAKCSPHPANPALEGLLQ